MSALLLLTHTLTHNRKAAGGFSGLFSKSNRHFPSHTALIGLEITLFFLQGDFGTKRPCVQVTSLRPVKTPGNRVFMRFPGVFFFCGIGWVSTTTHAVTHTGISRVFLGVCADGLFYRGAFLYSSAAPRHGRTNASFWRSVAFGGHFSTPPFGSVIGRKRGVLFLPATLT